jgi:hypothetical protein
MTWSKVQSLKTAEKNSSATITSQEAIRDAITCRPFPGKQHLQQQL